MRRIIAVLSFMIMVKDVFGLDFILSQRMNANSQNIMLISPGGVNKRLTKGDNDFDPAWSPDGTKIAFTSWRGDTGGVFIADAEGKSPSEVAPAGSNPAWSPDGTKIAFVGADGLRNTIFVCDVNGQNVQDVTSDINTIFRSQISWSPDGTKIAFITKESVENFELCFVTISSMKVTRLLTKGYHNFPAWSPDGTLIAFSGESGGDLHLFVTALDGNIRQITKFGGSADVRYPEWIDDDRLAFISSGRKPNVEALETINADGSGLMTIYWVNQPVGLTSPKPRPTPSYAITPAGRVATTWGELKRE